MLKSLELSGFKSFAKKSEIPFTSRITAIVGPNGSGKSNVAEAFRFVLGEQSMKSLRSKKSEDLIFNGGENQSRANRASARLIFDNSKRLFNVDFDEVSIERVIHRDSSSEYLVNGTAVRLKDIIELLSVAHIGVSGHHMISQGEADRILNTNPKERREMIEDALGLKIFQYKREESKRKLEKTRENMAQVELLRKEIAPHLRFLRKQVEKVEKTLAMRDELRSLYKEYLSREKSYLSTEQERIKNDSTLPKKRLEELEHALVATKKTLESGKKDDVASQRLMKVESELREFRTKKENIERDIYHLEGEISGIERTIAKANRASVNQNSLLVPFSDVKKFLTELSEEVEIAVEEPSLGQIKSFLEKAKTWISDFIHRFENQSVSPRIEQSNLEEETGALKEKINTLKVEMKEMADQEKKIESTYKEVRESIEKEKDSSRVAERDMFKIMAEENEIRGVLSVLKIQEDRHRIESESFKREIEEGAVLIGREIYDYEKHVSENHPDESRKEQEERKRVVERIKIRLEDSGALSAEDVTKEYKETSERDEFLGRELEDLGKSAVSLETIIDDLEIKLNSMFVEGIDKINKQFKEFFALMFGGGSASLHISKEKKKKRISEEELMMLDENIEQTEKEEEEVEMGVQIEVNLPRKKIKGLEMLSGGERALTSIALLFAMSQVNPPPFIILDETDAALDEANSKKYGDMLDNLSHKSQLIVITHNRETMSRAGVLYGVTMGKEGSSKLLSIAFSEALVVSK